MDSVGKWEFELGNEKLLDVRSANILSLLDLHNTEDLKEGHISFENFAIRKVYQNARG